MNRARATPTDSADASHARDRALRAAKAMAAMAGVQFNAAVADLDSGRRAVTAPDPEADAIIVPDATVEEAARETRDLHERVAALEAELAALRASLNVSRPPSRTASKPETGQPVYTRIAKRERVLAVINDPANAALSLRALGKLARVSPETIRSARSGGQASTS